MFEKESKEYARENTSYYGTDDCYDTDTEKVEQTFKDAAEFGYNKANEWHYVKDGDLPKEYDTVLVCTEFEKHKSCLICNYHYGKWWCADGKYADEVIAWKEIVLPKESE